MEYLLFPNKALVLCSGLFKANCYLTVVNQSLSTYIDSMIVMIASRDSIWVDRNNNIYVFAYKTALLLYQYIWTTCSYYIKAYAVKLGPFFSNFCQNAAFATVCIKTRLPYISFKILSYLLYLFFFNGK